MTRTRTPASTSITPLGVRTLVVLFALTLGALFGNARLASAQTGLTPDCVGLVTAFDEMRREVEAALDESASEYIAEQEMYGLSLTPEAVLKSLSVTHQLEQWMERQTREWLDIGPRKVNMPQEGGDPTLIRGRKLTKAGVGGERTWFTLANGNVKKIQIRVNKTGGRAETLVTVCRFGGSGGPEFEDDHLFASGSSTPRRDWVVDNLNNQYVTVYLVNNSFANNFHYNLRVKVLERYPEATPSQSQGGVTTTGGVDGDITVVASFNLQVFPADSDGTGTPLGTGQVDVYRWPNGQEKMFFPVLEPATSFMFRPLIQRGPNRITTLSTGNLANAVTLDKQQGGRWQGTLRGSDGNTYRIRLTPQ